MAAQRTSLNKQPMDRLVESLLRCSIIIVPDCACLQGLRGPTKYTSSISVMTTIVERRTSIERSMISLISTHFHRGLDHFVCERSVNTHFVPQCSNAIRRYVTQTLFKNDLMAFFGLRRVRGSNLLAALMAWTRRFSQTPRKTEENRPFFNLVP
jgi:hypothetical protein